MKNTNKLTLLIFLICASATAQEPVFFNFLNAIGNGKETSLKVDEKLIGTPFREGFATGGLGFLKPNILVKVANGDWESKSIDISLSPNDSPILICYLGEMESEDADGNPLPEPIRKIQHLLLPVRNDTATPKIRAIYCGNKKEVVIQKAQYGEGALPKSSSSVIKLEKLKPRLLSNVRTGTLFGYNNKQIGVFDSEISENLLMVFFDRDTPGEPELGFASTLDVVYK